MTISSNMILCNFIKFSLDSPSFCNTSFFKSDCIAVNGYNEDITGWGREDSELMLRLHNNGVKTRRLRYRGIVFHIWHTEKSKDRFELNDKIQQKVINESLTWCENGINKYIA